MEATLAAGIEENGPEPILPVGRLCRPRRGRLCRASASGCATHHSHLGGRQPSGEIQGPGDPNLRTDLQAAVPEHARGLGADSAGSGRLPPRDRAGNSVPSATASTGHRGQMRDRPHRRARWLASGAGNQSIQQRPAQRTLVHSRAVRGRRFSELNARAVRAQPIQPILPAMPMALAKVRVSRFRVKAVRRPARATPLRRRRAGALRSPAPSRDTRSATAAPRASASRPRSGCGRSARR